MPRRRAAERPAQRHPDLLVPWFPSDRGSENDGDAE